MPEMRRGKLLRVHLSEHDRYNGRPLYEAIVQKCRDLKIAGASVFKAVEGYGETAEIHRSHLMTHHQPILITIVDSEENVQKLIPAIDEMLNTGLIAVSDVELIRFERP